MDIYTNKSGKVVSLKQKPFKLEKNIQDLVESNLDVLLNLELVKSEFTINCKSY